MGFAFWGGDLAGLHTRWNWELHTIRGTALDLSAFIGSLPRALYIR
jgi:hypothetical protein